MNYLWGIVIFLLYLRWRQHVTIIRLRNEDKLESDGAGGWRVVPENRKVLDFTD